MEKPEENQQQSGSGLESSTCSPADLDVAFEERFENPKYPGKEYSTVYCLFDAERKFSRYFRDLLIEGAEAEFKEAMEEAFWCALIDCRRPDLAAAINAMASQYPENRDMFFKENDQSEARDQ